jgi:hypothetical protein
MTPEELAQEFLRQKSSRHHYIPQFLLEGFKNPEGLLYIYDKQKNRVLKTPRPPKSIFFEKDRNTIEVTETLKSSILEDILYFKIDDDASKVFKLFQTEELKSIEFTIENTSKLLLFLITLFWRIPYSDYAAEDVISRSIIDPQQLYPNEMKDDPTFKKIQRARLFKHQIDEMLKFGRKGKKLLNIHQTREDVYVIGDNPLLFRHNPIRFSEFNEIDFLFALTSKRIYSSTNEKLEVWKIVNSIRYNAAVINQSTRYVGCNNLEILNKSVHLYTEYKNQGRESEICRRIFESL